MAWEIVWEKAGGRGGKGGGTQKGRRKEEGREKGREGRKEQGHPRWTVWGESIHSWLAAQKSITVIQHINKLRKEKPFDQIISTQAEKNHLTSCSSHSWWRCSANKQIRRSSARLFASSAVPGERSWRSRKPNERKETRGGQASLGCT